MLVLVTYVEWDDVDLHWTDIYYLYNKVLISLIICWINSN